MATQAVVLGRGVGGLSAAQELAGRGFAVDIYESKAAWGGKARSLSVAGTGPVAARTFRASAASAFFPASTGTCPTP